MATHYELDLYHLDISFSFLYEPYKEPPPFLRVPQLFNGQIIFQSSAVRLNRNIYSSRPDLAVAANEHACAMCDVSSYRAPLVGSSSDNTLSTRHAKKTGCVLLKAMEQLELMHMRPLSYAIQNVRQFMDSLSNIDATLFHKPTVL